MMGMGKHLFVKRIFERIPETNWNKSQMDSQFLEVIDFYYVFLVYVNMRPFFDCLFNLQGQRGGIKCSPDLFLFFSKDALISRVITQLPICFRPLWGVITYNWIRGPPCLFDFFWGRALNDIWRFMLLVSCCFLVPGSLPLLLGKIGSKGFLEGTGFGISRRIF